MISVLKLEALLYNTLRKHTDIDVYNHVPDDAITPFIRIGDITVRPWLVTPPSAFITIMLGVFSDRQSNGEAIEISSRVREVLSANLTRKNFTNIIKVSILDTKIFQLKNLTWCAEVELEVHHHI